MTTTEPGDGLVESDWQEIAEGLCPFELRNVSHIDEFGTTILRNAWLKANAGTMTCIVGSNGRDQATLLTLMTGLARPSRGSICLDGIALSDLPLSTVRSQVALVLREPWLTRTSVAENIAFGLRGATRSEISDAADAVGIDRFIGDFAQGLDTVVAGGRTDHTHPGQHPQPGSEEIIDLTAGEQSTTTEAVTLTIGQRRRVALARALIRRPMVLILEDPTWGLEPDEEKDVLTLLDRLAENLVLIVASHRLSVARRAHQVLVIDKARLLPYSGASTEDGSSDHSALWDLSTGNTERDTEGNTEQDRRDPPTLAGGTVESMGGPRGEATRAQPWNILAGQEMAPGYTAAGLLGRSQHADVWVAWSRSRQRPVRIKVPSTEPVEYRSHEQLSREFKIVSRFRHPGLAAAYEADFDAEMPYVVHEYLITDSLAASLRYRTGGLTPLDALYIGFELAGSLNYLHQRGYAHLNLRPRHVRTRWDTIVITDFTYIRELGTTIPPEVGTGNGHRGEHAWFAPEQIPGATVSPPMDIYTLGVFIHTAIAGRLVVDQDQATPSAAHPSASARSGRRPRRPLVPFSALVESAPATMAETVDAMLAPEPADRPDAEEVLRRFRRILPRTLSRTQRRADDDDAHSPADVVGVNN